MRSKGTTAAGHSWDLQSCGRTVEGAEGNLLSHLGCHKKGNGQLEVLTRWLAGLSVPPVLPSINGATQVRN